MAQLEKARCGLVGKKLCLVLSAFCFKGMDTNPIWIEITVKFSMWLSCFAYANAWQSEIVSFNESFN